MNDQFQNFSSYHLRASITIYSIPSKTQNFSLPENFVYYIAKNPTWAIIYQKLINCCKYFYLKNPIITLRNMKSVVGTSQKHFSIDEINGIYFKMDKTKNKPIIFPKKIWLYGELIINKEENQNLLAALVISRIYRCEIFRLNLAHQVLSYNEFKILTLSETIIDLEFKKTIVKQQNGIILTMIELFKMFPNIQEFEFEATDGLNGLFSIPAGSAEKLIRIPHFVNLKRIWILNAAQTFDFQTFFNGLKETSPYLDIFLMFSSLISQNYKILIQNYIHQIAALGLTENLPPMIAYADINYNVAIKLYDLRKSYETLHGLTL